MLVRLPEMPNVAGLSSLPSSLTLPSNATILLSLFFALFLLLLVHATFVLIREYILRAKQQFEQKKRAPFVVQEQGTAASSPSLKSSPPPSLSSPSVLLSQSEKPKVERVRVTASALEQQRMRIPSAAQEKWSWSTTGLFNWLKWDTSLPMSFSVRNDNMKSRRVNVSAGVSSMHMAAPPRVTPVASQPHSQTPRLHRVGSWQQVRKAGPAFETPLPAMYQTDVPASMAKIIMSRHTYRKPTLRPPSRPPSPTSQAQASRRPPSIV